MIVVAESNLGNAYGVVFIDDGETTVLEQRQNGIAGIQIASAIVEVAGGQQNLRRGDAVTDQTILVGAHEERLTDGGAGLELT